MCQSHLNNRQYSLCLFENNPSLIINEKINYANQHFLTDNEYEDLINPYNKISNFYISPKLHKSTELNKNKNFE